MTLSAEAGKVNVFNKNRIIGKHNAQQKIDAFRWDYNEHHPHRSLKGLSPREFAERLLTTTADSPSQ